MKQIRIKIQNKIASLVDKEQYIVCHNSDYIAVFEFDDEWNEYPVKTARVYVTPDNYIDLVFEGNECELPPIEDSSMCSIGVFAGNISTSTPAYIPCRTSITSRAGTPAPPKEDVYAQLMALANETKAVAESVRADANNGEFVGEKGDKGDKGEDGHTPQKGVDYWTEADKQEIKTYIDDQFGDVEQALDVILDIQNSLIGGDSV